MIFISVEESKHGTSLVIQWQRFCALNAGDLGSILDPGTGSHATTKSLHANVKDPTYHN